DKVHHGVRLFREGATLSEFCWGNRDFCVDAELARLWMIRLFCQQYELYARRLDDPGSGNWQLRIVAQENHLPQGERLTPCGDETVLLLGEARGESEPSEDRDVFDLKPNRYRGTR